MVEPATSADVRDTDEPSDCIRRIWGEALGISDVGPGDDLLLLGSDSSAKFRVVAALHSALGASTRLKNVMAAGTPRALTSIIEAPTRPVLSPASLSAGVEACDGRPFPLTPVQIDYWLGSGQSSTRVRVAPTSTPAFKHRASPARIRLSAGLWHDAKCG